MIKRFISLLLIVMMLASMAVVVSSYDVDDFTDVSSYMTNYENALRYTVEEKEVLTGTSATTFEPATNLKRCDTVLALARVFTVDLSEYDDYSNPFTDVPNNAYYANAVKWAYHDGIVSGTSATQFSPNDLIQKQAVCLLLYRCCTAYDISLPDNGSTAQFADDSSIQSAYKTAVYRLYRAGIIEGDQNGYFNPRTSMKRIYFAQFLFKYYNPTVPAKPQPTVSSKTGSSITVTWPAVSGANGYRVKINNGNWINTSARSYTFSNLSSNTTYIIRVSSKKNYMRTSLYSPYASISVKTDHKYYATVNNYFDGGLLVMLNQGISPTSTQINGYMDEVAARYLELFDLEISRNNAEYFCSIIDSCKGVDHPERLREYCNHEGNQHSVLFKYSDDPADDNYAVLSENFNTVTSPAGSNVLTKVYWTAHKVKRFYDSSEECIRARSYLYNVYMIDYIKVTDETTQAEINSWINTFFTTSVYGRIMHELNHQYGAPDHYHEQTDNNIRSCKRAISNGGDGFCSDSNCNSINGTQYRPATCIMNTSYGDISPSDIICSDCKSEIITHLNSHHKQ
ncbi:MAG: S-layer homology domain-containing protein [Clostridia bacterium]|nr:S-layer homology domain-containing protein [Clostridia bacterium]